MPGITESPTMPTRKRKLATEDPIEIDLAAPEPQSKKALRRVKKGKTSEPKEGSKAVEQETETQTSTDQPSKRTGFGIWIGNLPFTTSRDDLQKFFTTDGPLEPNEITRIHVPNGEKHRGVQQNKGFAYIDFSKSEAVAKAISLSEKLVGGRRVLIKDANNFAGRPEKSKADIAAKPGHPPSRKIFVGNLSFDVTKLMLEQHFKPCGAITNIHVASFEDSGKCKGYGWVEFQDIESAESAVRGFLKVPEDDVAQESSEDESNAESDDDTKKKAKKIKMKKLWVNRIQGRTLRTEFAEDQTTRYNKRFGKDDQSKDASSGEGRKTGSRDAGRPRPSARENTDRSQATRHKVPKIDDSRYSKDTVQRLSGAIIEAQGKKTTFD